MRNALAFCSPICIMLLFGTNQLRGNKRVTNFMAESQPFCIFGRNWRSSNMLPCTQFQKNMCLSNWIPFVTHFPIRTPKNWTWNPRTGVGAWSVSSQSWDFELAQRATPTVGLEPTTTRLRALRSTDWARRAPAATWKFEHLALNYSGFSCFHKLFPFSIHFMPSLSPSSFLFRFPCLLFRFHFLRFDLFYVPFSFVLLLVSLAVLVLFPFALFCFFSFVLFRAFLFPSVFVFFPHSFGNSWVTAARVLPCGRVSSRVR